MRENIHYGGFGDAFGPIEYDNTKFLDDPDAIIDNDYVAFASAIYFYMTPSVYKPSMHEIMTGFWVPNATDTKQKIYPGFGATVAILNGEEECNLGYDSQAGAKRYVNYQRLLTSFGLWPGEAH